MRRNGFIRIKKGNKFTCIVSIYLLTITYTWADTSADISESMELEDNSEVFEEVDNTLNNRNDNGLPYFLKPKNMHPLVAKPGGAALRLKCVAGGNPMPNITWLKDTLPVNRNFGARVNYQKSLMEMEDCTTSDSGNYTCVVCNLHGCVNYTFRVHIIEQYPSKPYIKEGYPKNVTVLVNSSIKLDCPAYSDNEVFIQWIKPDPYVPEGETAPKGIILQNGYDNPDNQEIFELHDITHSDEGWYTCVVANSLGTTYANAYLKVADKLTWSFDLEGTTTQRTTSMPTSSGIELLTVIIFFIIFSIVAVIAAFVVFHLLDKRRLARTSEDSFIKLVKIEKPMVINDSQELVLPVVKLERHPISNNMCEVWEYQLVGDKNWEFPRKNLRFEETIGEGAFGTVAKAQAYGIVKKDLTTAVAIKMLKAEHNDIHMINLVIEMEVMKLIGKHKNILNLLGCCTQGGPLLIIMEYVSRGNLKDFLNKFKSSPMNISAEKINFERENLFPEKMLVSFALQIATGMEYLASQRYVHRDLAARNVLVTEDFTMKIADFGLARDVHNSKYYKMATNDLLPIKWMAYESLKQGIYTNQTDIWSYGVLFWEIMTLGDTPYAGIQVENLFSMLNCGHRLEKPLHCSDDVYNVMCQCWSLEPNDRPNFSNIMKTLNKIITEVNDDLLMPELAQLDIPLINQKSIDCNPNEIALPRPPLGDFNVDFLKNF